jgi:hypothetical protein
MPSDLSTGLGVLVDRSRQFLAGGGRGIPPHHLALRADQHGGRYVGHVERPRPLTVLVLDDEDIV